MATNLLQRESLFSLSLPSPSQQLFTWSTCAATITLVNNCRGNERNKHALTSWVARSDLYSSHEKNFVRGCHRTAAGRWSADPVEEAKHKHIQSHLQCLDSSGQLVQRCKKDQVKLCVFSMNRLKKTTNQRAPLWCTEQSPCGRGVCSGWTTWRWRDGPATRYTGWI